MLHNNRSFMSFAAFDIVIYTNKIQLVYETYWFYFDYTLVTLDPSSPPFLIKSFDARKNFYNQS